MNLSKGLELGTNAINKTVYITPKTRSTHMHIVGSTGEGKSKFLEHMIRQDIIENHGLCLLDPHGSLYDNVVRWCETKGMLSRDRPKKIILFDPSEEHWTFGFNPLNLGSKELSYHVDAMVKAVAKVWGGEDTDRTPLLKRCLRVLFHALAEKNLSLVEARYLLDRTDKTVRKYLTHDIVNPDIRTEWTYFNSLKPKPFYDEFGSTINRMIEFLANPVIRTIIGQTQDTLDFRKIMDEGYILLVKLSAKDRISKDNAQLLGTLIINDLFMTALGRKEGARPFYLYIDECYDFVNEDIGYILDQTRKFGLHMILAHQHLDQLKKAGDVVYKSVMTNARTKVIFGGLDFDDAEILVKNVFLGELDLQEWKEGLARPTVVAYNRVWFENYSKSRSSSNGGSTAEMTGGSEASGHSHGRSIQRSPNPSGQDIVTDSAASQRTSTTTHSKTETRTWQETEAESEGTSEGLEPELEDLPIESYSLEEQIWRAISLMVNQPARHAIIKLPKQKSQFLKVPIVKKGDARESRVENFKHKCYQLADFVHPKERIEVQIGERHRTLELKALEYEAGVSLDGTLPRKDGEGEDFRE